MVYDVRSKSKVRLAATRSGARGNSEASRKRQRPVVCDLIVIRGKDADGKIIPVALKAETVLGPDKRPRWQKGGQVRAFTQSQLWWSLHDPDYKELLDMRGKDDVESPLGQWTRLECICAGKRIRIKVTGKHVNEAFDAYPSAGKILLELEGFEIFFRKVEIRPLP
jgi:hypothetical protein